MHVLQTAHTDLEVFCLDKEVYRVKQLLRDRLSDYVYNGFWFSPEADYVRKCLNLAAESVTGSVKLELYKGNGEFKTSDFCFCELAVVMVNWTTVNVLRLLEKSAVKV